MRQILACKLGLSHSILGGIDFCVAVSGLALLSAFPAQTLLLVLG